MRTVLMTTPLLRPAAVTTPLKTICWRRRPVRSTHSTARMQQVGIALTLHGWQGSSVLPRCIGSSVHPVLLCVLHAVCHNPDLRHALHFCLFRFTSVVRTSTGHSPYLVFKLVLLNTATLLAMARTCRHKRSARPSLLPQSVCG